MPKQNRNINNRAIKKVLTKRLAHLLNRNHNEVEEIVDAFFHEVSQELLKGNRVLINGFGTLSIKHRTGTYFGKRDVVQKLGVFKLGYGLKNGDSNHEEHKSDGDVPKGTD